MYQYIAKLIRVIDGDTVDALVDLGFDVWVKKRIRLYGINTPETRTRDLEEKKAGIAAKERLETLIRIDVKSCHFLNDKLRKKTRLKCRKI